jgi:FkbM family methyltransferase
MVSDATQSYLDHLNDLGWQVNDAVQTIIEHITTATDWDSPASGFDLNNVGVAALINAQDCEDLAIKASLLELAQEAFAEGEVEYPLCKAHHALIKVLTGNFQAASQQTFATLLQLQLALETVTEDVPLGLIYFPAHWYSRAVERGQELEQLYGASNGIAQAYAYLNQVFVRSAQVFYNATGQWTLSIAAQINPHLLVAQLKQGIAARMAQQFEGFINLHNAYRLAPNNPTVLQSLALAYREIGDSSVTRHYWQLAQQRCLPQDDPAGVWTQADPEGSFTYVPFDQGVTLAVQPSFSSIVTSVLLGEGDWFESEMEFWRDRLKQGMTVIDVGANAGVYTFSAATRVGAEGKVIAIEPFPACVGYLQETCRVNQLDWVRVYGAAASDHAGSIRLSIHGASELNEVIAEDVEVAPGQAVEVPCLTLDGLIETEQLATVDLLKLDAEGHEINVLHGAKRLLREYSPIILYENIAGSQGNNIEVAEFLEEQGYQLNVYQPYLKQLIALNSLEELSGHLNIIATPRKIRAA